MSNITLFLHVSFDLQNVLPEEKPCAATVPWDEVRQTFKKMALLHFLHRLQDVVSNWIIWVVKLVYLWRIVH